jgi:predicted Fe-S protein YdhL (DUF1289 family)
MIIKKVIDFFINSKTPCSECGVLLTRKQNNIDIFCVKCREEKMNWIREGQEERRKFLRKNGIDI